MKQYIISNILLLFAAGIAAVGTTSCHDDVFDTQDNFPVDTNMLTFDASIGKCAVSTRSEDVPSDIDPIEIGDGENQLYLHTYVCDNGYDPVEFQPEAATRGVQVYDMASLVSVHSSFGVEANFVERPGFPSYIDMKEGEKVNGDDNFWRAKGPVIYWPGDDAKLHFHAWAPINLPSAVQNLNKQQNMVSFDYTAEKSKDGNTDAEAQTDFLWAINKGCSKSTSTNGRAKLHFTHPLSAIKFAVRDVIAGTVNRITIKNVFSKGSCTYTATESGEGTYTWTNHSDKSDFSQVFKVDFTPSADKSDVSITSHKPEATFMMIPQMISDDAVIEIEIVQKGMKNPDGSDAPDRTLTLKGKIKVDDDTNNPNHVSAWLPGKEYVYTISTTKDNWIYVFDAEGNEAEGIDNIYVYSPSDERFDAFENTAYFKVKSYRYKANDHTQIEALPWSASHGGSYSYWVNGSNETKYPINNPELKYVENDNWITDTFATSLKGDGIASHSNNLETHDLIFLPHYVSTTWKGDETMQAYPHYEGFDEETPYDLSTFGGRRSRTTANCYVIDRGGWYMLPLAYGNSVKNGGNNPSAYTSACTASGIKVKKVLVDYNNQNITQPYIKGVNDQFSAELIWQDAYDLIDNVELFKVKTTGEQMIRFFVESNNLQQGNAIVALKDGNGNVVWSWHIWATEHWLDKDSRLPHVYDSSNAAFGFVANAVTGIREKGDVEVTHNQHGRSFMMSPYNIGYCDPKSVLYLKRKNNMEFVQYMPDGTTPTKKTDRLPIIQEGATIDYKYANNTYYQWGRKDPMRGYYNHENDTKRVFGPLQSKIEPQEGITIGKSIQKPHVFFAGKGESGSKYEDWLSDPTSNLWNNNADLGNETYSIVAFKSDMWSHTKTVYDPSPAGYMVPNAGVWRFLVKNLSDELYSGKGYKLNDFKAKINGAYIDDYNYKIWAKGTVNNNSEAIFFSSTGNRWWSSQMILDKDKPTQWTPQAGDNFGRNVSYAWSNRQSNGNNAYGMALGLDTDRESIENVSQDEKLYYVGTQFIGRRAMCRPVRAIREP